MKKEIGLWLAKQGGYNECHDCIIARNEKADWLKAEQEYKNLIRSLEAKLRDAS